MNINILVKLYKESYIVIFSLQHSSFFTSKIKQLQESVYTTYFVNKCLQFIYIYTVQSVLVYSVM